MADDWKSPSFRQSVVAKIDEAIRQSGNPTPKTAAEMETHFFQRATTKEDYLNFLARLLIHIKELNNKQKGAGVAGAAIGGNMQQQNQQQSGGQDPINALQTMTRQNTAAPPQMMNQMNVRPQMMNMQMDPQQQQQQQMNQMVMNQQQQQQMQPQQTQQQPHMMNQFNQNMSMGNPMMQQQMAPNQSNIGQPMNQPGSVLLNQLSQQGMNPVNPGMPRPRFPTQQAKLAPQPQQQQQPQQQPQAQPMQPQQQQQLMNQQMINQQLMMRKQQQQAQQQQQQNQQQSNEMQMQQNQGPATPQFVQGPVQGVGVPSPAAMPMQSMTSVASIGSGPMGAPSPAYVHSPGNVQIASSPATAARMGAPQQPQQRGMAGLGNLLPPPSPSMTNAPTPGGMLHTPQGAGMGAPIAGPGGPNGPMSVGNSSEDQLYFEKVRQLSRFIEPLSRLINRYGDGDDSEKLSKMKIMLEVLKNPNKRMPMDTLLKCEAVLEKMDFKRTDTGSVAPPSVASVPSLSVAVPSVKEQPPAATAQLHPLLETIANQARSPYINHTLKRTFAPAVDALVGCDIGPPSPVKMGRHTSGDSIETFETGDIDELMVIVEREVANMEPRVRVDLNPLHLPGSQDLHLICILQDKGVPPVPPLKIIVPHDYPRTAPVCPMDQQEYDVNGFTRAILQGLRNRIRHLPPRHSFSQVLNCWEMSLRHACGSTNVKDIGTASLILGV